MSLLGGSASDDRRRRVLTDEVIGPRSASASAASSAPASSPLQKRLPRNRSADSLDRYPRVVDLVPQRFTSLVVLSTVGLLSVAALLAGHIWMPHLAAAVGTTRLAALDLATESGLGAWLSSMMLALTAALAVMVYAVRRHKADDYHGRYRIWLGAAAAALLLSADASGALHATFEDAMTHLAGATGIGSGAVYSYAAYALLLGPISLRLVIDMRRCRTSTATLIAAVLCYSATVIARAGWLPSAAAVNATLVDAGGQLLGDLLLLLAITLHARYVIRDELGLVPYDAPKEKPAARSKSAAAASGAASTSGKRSDLDLPKSSATTAASRSHADDSDDEDDFDEDNSARRDSQRYRIDQEADYASGRKLNKAQRKALRRQKEMERRGEYD